MRLEEQRLVKQAVRHIFENRRDGDLLMDVRPDITWDELQAQANNRREWRRSVEKMRMQAMGEDWVESKNRVKDSRKKFKIVKPPAS